MSFTVSSIYIYPVKSLAGFSVTEAAVTAKGFEHDRRWMLVDKAG
ncbi:MAG: MOSC domain-containing protein [Chitinophagaceae bacterium]|nr:MOSC domain-containing protein [Chitinophagaceae bacterium]